MSTAIFGGTFDPVHKGHIAMVRSVLSEFSPERVIVVPNGNPPHKKDSNITDFSHRYNMLRLAFSHMDNVVISDYEEDGTKYRYSIDTMRHFRKLYGDDTFFVIGQDSLCSIHTWHMYRTLLEENRFILFPRVDFGSAKELASSYRGITKEILVSSMPLFPLSSTMIRESMCDDNACEYVTQEVFDYIKEHGLYGGSYDGQ